MIEGREFVVPFGYEGEINPEEIAKNAIKKASVKYNMIINARRELKEAGIDVGEIQFYDSSAEKYTKLLKENNRAVINQRVLNLVKHWLWLIITEVNKYLKKEIKYLTIIQKRLV